MGHRTELEGRFLWGAGRSVALSELASGTSLDCPREELVGKSILLGTVEQLHAALALIELDGIARRLVLCPPDTSVKHLPLILEAAEIDVVVSDGTLRRGTVPAHIRLVQSGGCLVPSAPFKTGACRTDWVLLTSGTTGVPKLVLHTLSTLTGAIKPNSASPMPRPVWSTFYDIRRYGGLQIFLRGLLGSGSLVLSSWSESTADFLDRCGSRGVTHISGTPSHWRRALMSASANRIKPRYVRLSGEVADQAILDDLWAFYPEASVAHAFASTEAGVGFEVNDGIAGFPVRFIGRHGEIEMKVEDGSLRIRSPLTATCYLGSAGGTLRDPDGFVDTGDLVERIGDRYHFRGRRGGVINVGGMKVYPEEIEAVINRHPAVQMSLVKAHKNPFTGAVVTATVVLRSYARPGTEHQSDAALQRDITEICRRNLPSYKVPALISFVPSMTLSASGKIARPNA
jgi:acyl-CoA synthetase (AMP-forming)/AMP-acid ligase II